MNCDDVDVALAVAAVSGGLAAEDRGQVEAHLRDCARCAEAAREYRATAGRLAVAAEPVVPPAHLRAAILGEVQRDAERRWRVADVRRGSWRGRLAALWAAIPQGRAFTAAGAVAAAALIAVGVWAGVGGRGSAPGSTVTALHATVPGSPASEGSVVYFPSQATAVVRFAALPDPGGRVYELWVIRGGGAPVPDGFLTRQPDGSWAAAMQHVSPGGATIAATMEPPQGSATPTGPRVLVAQLAS